MLKGNFVMCFLNLRNMIRTLRNGARKRNPEIKAVQGSLGGSLQNWSAVGLTGQTAKQPFDHYQTAD